jgi:hypothetical protein
VKSKQQVERFACNLLGLLVDADEHVNEASGFMKCLEILA